MSPEEAQTQQGVTANRFAILCAEYGVEPSIALENPQVVAALKAGDLRDLEETLSELF